MQTTQKSWMVEWTPGIWRRITQPFRNPSFLIPTYLASRYNNSGATGMPAGPYVQEYDVQLSRGINRTDLGVYPMVANLTVKWKPEVVQGYEARKTLLGNSCHDLDVYHSQAAFSCNALLLAELQRKINRAKVSLQEVIKLRQNISAKWTDLVKQIHETIKEGLKYDPYYADQYIKEHETSVVIPGTANYRSRRWSQLEGEEVVHLYNLCKAYLEDMTTHWDELVTRIIEPSVVGRGIRARSPDIDGIFPTYALEYDRSRQVAYIPYLSGWGAFLPESVKDKVYQQIVNAASDILNCQILLPPVLKGAYWKTITDMIDQGNSMITGDGKNWETYSATLTGLYSQAVNDGLPQYMSGAWMTSLNATIASFILLDARYGNRGGFKAVGALGDDTVIIGKPENIKKVKDLPEVWEIDPIGTNHRVILGLICLPNGKGTFPGFFRITVDRGDKKIPMRIGESYSHIAGSISEDSFLIYREIMEKGTLHDEPLVDMIAKRQHAEFWELYRSPERTEAFQQSSEYVFEVVPETSEYAYEE